VSAEAVSTLAASGIGDAPMAHRAPARATRATNEVRRKVADRPLSKQTLTAPAAGATLTKQMFDSAEGSR
jgi:hypothetical protein